MNRLHRTSSLQHQIDLIAVPVFVADECDDHRFRFVAINSPYALLSGLSKVEIIGREPCEISADPASSRTILMKYRQCVGTRDPVSFRDRIGTGDAAVPVETTLQKIVMPDTNLHRIVGTALLAGDHHAATSDIEFYITLARNSLTTIEMLMKAGQRQTLLSISEREATEILTRKALLALQDAERAAERLAQCEKPLESGTAKAVRNLLLH